MPIRNSLFLPFLKTIIRSPLRLSRAFLRRPTSSMMCSYWLPLDKHSNCWSERSFSLLQMVPESATTLLELGCGRQDIRAEVRKRMMYQPSDLVKRSDDCIVLDLNNLNHINAMVLPSYDVVLASGVLEYVKDLPSALDWACQIADSLIVSYCSLDGLSDLATRMESKWLNHYTTQEFVQMFAARGFDLIVCSEWQQQSLFRFDRS